MFLLKFNKNLANGNIDCSTLLKLSEILKNVAVNTKSTLKRSHLINCNIWALLLLLIKSVGDKLDKNGNLKEG